MKQNATISDLYSRKINFLNSVKSELEKEKINYENKITDKYEAWEKELEQREEALMQQNP